VAQRLNREVIANAGLELLAKGGVDGITMRSLATELGVQAPTLYWHVRSKRELLDAMADVIAADVVDRLRPMRPGQTVEDWLADMARALRTAMLRYRDGARVFVGSLTPAAQPATEVALSALCGAGYSLEAAAEVVATLLHYTTGSAIEDQARTGVDYPENPYTAELADPQEFPLFAKARGTLFNPDADAAFEKGLSIVLAGIRATRTGAAN
jgi:TetR/AcrR family transcriptional regulator, tetracycline repressor protein